MSRRNHTFTGTWYTLISFWVLRFQVEFKIMEDMFCGVLELLNTTPPSLGGARFCIRFTGNITVFCLISLIKQKAFKTRAQSS